MRRLRPDWRGTGSLSTLGLEVALSVVLPLLAGNWADGRFSTAPWLALLGFAFGVAAAVAAMMRAWRELQAIAAKEQREEGNPAPTYPYADKPADEKDRARPRDEAREPPEDDDPDA